MNALTTPTLLPEPAEISARQFDLTIKRLADDLTYGNDASRFVGPGVDYAQTRPYTLGDSIRSIDWKVTARTGRVHVKEYDAPKRVTVYVVVDTSHSMMVASGALSKHGLGVWAAATIALASIRRRSPVSLISGGDRGSAPPPTLSRSLVMRWLDGLRVESVGEGTFAAKRLDQILRVADRMSLVVLISDLHDPAMIDAAIRLRQRHDVVVLQPMDPAERGGLRAGFVRGEEAETGAEVFLTSGRRIRGERLDGKSPGKLLADGAIDHVPVGTDEPVGTILAALKRVVHSRGGGRIAR